MIGARVDVLAWFDGVIAGSESMDRASGIGPSTHTNSARNARAAVAELIEVSSALLAFRVGEYPRLGYLPDNDVTRAQLDALATALANIGPQS